MKVLRVRYGFATNSSSLHSIVWKSSLPSDVVKNGSLEYEFGWEMFLQKTRAEKQNYLLTTLATNLYNWRDHGDLDNGLSLIKDAPESIKTLLGYDDETEYPKDYVYVDHQSIFSIPRRLNGELMYDFFEEFCKEILDNDDIAILGGNDNSDEYRDVHEKASHPAIDDIYKSYLENNNLKGRTNKDSYTIFNVGDGTKSHIAKASFSHIEQSEKASSPELIDLKITDYCPIGCSFCYQNSTVEGIHAPLETIKSILLLAKESEVFEIAIGGGEPTMHPDFCEILEYGSSIGLTMNFTTKSTKWLNSEKILDAVKKYSRGFAYSITPDDDFKKIRDLFVKNHSLYQVSFQYILDAFPMSEWEKLLKHDSIGKLTLLGYKTNGRGGEKPYHNSGWLNVFVNKEHRWNVNGLGIDTALANQYKQELEASNTDTRLYYTKEGLYSMYIDAVESKCASSSYSEVFHNIECMTIKEMFKKCDVE